MGLDSNTYEPARTETLKRFLNLYNADLIKCISGEEAEYIHTILNRREERETKHRDSFGNFEFSFTQKPYYQPYLDHFCIELLKKYKLSKRRLWGKHNFALVLSHDVDLVNKNHPKQDFRAAIKHLKHGKGLKKVHFLLHLLLTLRNAIFRLKNGGDTLWDYHLWCDLEEQYKYRSTSFFFVRPRLSQLHVYDCDFKLTDTFRFRNKKVNVIDYIKELESKGHEIGLHGSYHAAKDAEMVKQQKEQLNQLTRKPICSYRNHYLHFDIEESPNVLASNDILVDGTLGFNRDIGYRAGTSLPFLLKTDSSPLLEVPQVVMDSALFLSNSLELDLELAKKKVSRIINQVEETGGVLTLNFHPDKISKPFFFDIYRFILEECHKKNALNLTMGELAQKVLSLD